jgi:hypothetical protein
MTLIARDLRDELGPEKIVLIREPRVGLEAVVAVDNVACGPAIGGVRMAPDVTAEEVVRLARAMTLKNAAAGLPHGGGKAGILADPACAPDRKEALVRTFARMIRGLTEYIPGPDMETNEACMAWIRDEIGRAVGLPRVVGGIPLDEIGATGFGLAVAADVGALTRVSRRQPGAGLDGDRGEDSTHDAGNAGAGAGASPRATSGCHRDGARPDCRGDAIPAALMEQECGVRSVYRQGGRLVARRYAIATREGRHADPRAR